MKPYKPIELPLKNIDYNKLIETVNREQEYSDLQRIAGINSE